MSTHSREQMSLLEEAQRWERLCQSGSDADRAAFGAWIRRSPEHLQAYLMNQALQVELQNLDPHKKLELREFLERAGGNVVPLGRTRSWPQLSARVPARSRTLWPALAIALCLTLVLVWVLPLRHSPEWVGYATATGEQRRIALADGSIIELNTQSQVRVNYESRWRHVELLAGEAVFTVHHDLHRPFRVEARGTLIEDVGTQFSVYVRPDASTTIAVLDGLVRVGKESSAPSSPVSGPPHPREHALSTQLAQGEELRIDGDGSVTQRSGLNLAETASWRQHRLWFEGASLEHIAAEFNRYSTHKMRVAEDARRAPKRYTVTFNPYDPDSFIDYLRSDPDIRIEPGRDETVIQLR